MQVHRAALLLLASVAVLAAIAGCGGDDANVETLPTVAVVQDTATAPPPQQVQAQPSPSQPLDPTASSAEGGIIAIEAREARFVRNFWTIAVGESLTIQLNNADSQQHNLRLAGPDGEYQTQDDAITVPEAINGGQSGELTFAPLVQGPYTFRCDFHPDTMGGLIVVGPGVP